MGSWILIAILIGFLGLSAWFSYDVWNAEDTVMSVHGYIALALGVAFSLIVGIGLMSLIYYSNRKGYDAPAERRVDGEDR
jgi:hypothetical protein